ncbi:MAG: Gfo/Idh/MocA family oxidoreductase [Verrucomicrobiia bacterium]|jgi:myo-inositol 2-dehydrogenase/D-chiro-inositol 1-dehydrogenase
MKSQSDSNPSRRDFIKTSTAVAAGAIAFPSITLGEPDSRKLKIGFIGCGGRGTGAASQALKADSNVELWSMGDVFQEKMDSSLQTLANTAGVDPEQLKVDPKRQFVGLDAYEKVLDSGVDVVILTTPPGFRPMQFKAAVEAGKHIFLEKPMATDAPGLRQVMASVEEAKKKNISVVAGYCWRYDYARREFYRRIAEGQIGDVRAIYATYYTGPVKSMPADDARDPSWSDIEWQVRNWYNFTYLGGDGLVEQAIHSVDKIAWVMNDVPPLSCVAVGGRQIPNNAGNIFDHCEVNYLYKDGVRGFLGCRQQDKCHGENNDYIIGATGTAEISRGQLKIFNGEDKWRYEGPKPNMYQVEHNEMYAAIRAGKPLNDGDRMCTSTLMGIMGRMAAYTGAQVTWEMALNSKEDLFPKDLNWESGEHAPPAIAQPGLRKFI